MADAAPPRVFIIYSHDSDAHRDRVLDFADRLRADGIDAMIDQYEPHPPEGWPDWCDAQIRKADFVLAVCTETYLRRFIGEEEAGKGRGVRWEGHLTNQHLWDAGAVSRKFVPGAVLRRVGQECADPTQKPDDLLDRETGRPHHGRARNYEHRPSINHYGSVSMGSGLAGSVHAPE